MSAPGFFTTDREYRLPHPAVSLRIIMVTHAALTKAFELLRAEMPGGFHLATAKEDEITLRLLMILEDRLLRTREVAGFDRRRFGNVVRAPEISNYDGTHPSKKPDMVFFLLKREHFPIRSSQDGLFAECKPVDDDHSIGQHYCDRGIVRFVQGDYAWAMQDGMMIAYVRGERTIAGNLAPVMATEPRQTALGYPTPPLAVSTSSASGSGEQLHSTVHSRPFDWPNGQGPACKIRLFHSWHGCP